ncbi:PREDICTED: uncharacterized protein LOC108618655 [Drosophila arizonae]|uniref:Uncharacterized protein LOC108618655 n=1 Tax=Drosophila arizonae TaxID=7263 RepID=A0ABM1PSP9_DROAR|nr:PREDICTED: uncharacterized protein LOC108618655 [Drosophila arizonae]
MNSKSFKDVPTEITDTNLVMFMRKHVEPVPYKTIIAHFCTSESKMELMKSKLNKTLVMSINSGLIVHCNNFFFARSHADDMEDVIDLSQVDEASSDVSIISFSSCESVDYPITPKDKKTPNKANPSPVAVPKKRRQKKKSNAE